MRPRARFGPLDLFNPPVREWFARALGAPTRPQELGWPAISRGESTLILAPTGSGKTLAAFLWCLDRLMFARGGHGCRVLYVSPLKALAVDVEKNLRVPLAGIAELAVQRGDDHVLPSIAIRTGDTTAGDRARFARHPSDILITTPESLYLLLTSKARDALRTVETVIIDEIHALVPTKRGAHLSVSLERLAARTLGPLQRIGLSATQRPLDEVARFLGGVERFRPGTRSVTGRQPPAETTDQALAREFASPRGTVRYRPVTIVDAGATKRLKLSIELPVEDAARRDGPAARSIKPPDPAATDARARPSAWSAIHPRLLELIRAHRTTLIFVNSRRLAERLAGAINELAGETLVRSHHGSLAREQRTIVEDLLKGGQLRALVATSTLELGIDMGTIDLVVQIEAPLSVASGLQRIGRSGHRIDSVSEGIIFPKFRADLVALAAVARAMHDGAVEATRYPRNPLDIAAQQIVAMTAMDDWPVDDLFATLRQAAPFAELSRRVFEEVLDMLAGRYPSDEFAELRPRLTWHRAAGTLTTRSGARSVAVVNGGTIPDRGLYGVFLAGPASSRGPQGVRVGELDEEMVFETKVGETFVLGASTWRVDTITHDRVLVSPAPGEPGKMPFWKGDRAGRPLELGLAIGRLTRDLLDLPAPAAVDRLTRHHDLDARAAESLLEYLRDQRLATGDVPDNSTIVVERVRDELGDWRVCVLSPRGGPIHAPWAMAAAARIHERTGVDVETIWGDDGFVVRFPDVDEPPDSALLFPDPAEVQALVAGQLGGTALFAAKFRENASRSLLLPKRRPGMRAPLWQQRKRAGDLLAVAARFGSFPVLLETYRECLRDYFDMPSLVATLADVKKGVVKVATVDAPHPSPFAASLLFGYVANFLYDGDAPLAERRAQALVVDQSQLRELLGDAELRGLLDAEAIDASERQLQRLEAKYHARNPDAVHDMFLGLGDLTAAEVGARAVGLDLEVTLPSLATEGRIVLIVLAGETRYIAVEDAARYRDALAVALPPGIPAALLTGVQDPAGDLAHRYARTHGPFTAPECAARFGMEETTMNALLGRLVSEDRLVEGQFRPSGSGHEFVDADVLRLIRRRSLARLRHEVEPVDPDVFTRFATTWQGTVRHRRGADALLDAIEQLQGAPLPASIVESEILPARIEHFEPADLDAVMAAGEVVWAGVEPLGGHDGRISLYLADAAPRLLPPQVGPEDLDARQSAIVDALRVRGASFFGPLHEAVGGGFPGDTVTALWALVWKGRVANDTFHALRAHVQGPADTRRARRQEPAVPFRSRRLVPASAEGRWSMVARQTAAGHAARGSRVGATGWLTAATQQLLARHGVLTREAVMAESIPGGFGAIYPVLKAMEDGGRLRRGYFVAGLGATQFALPGALDSLRTLRDRDPDNAEVVVLAAADPANPYGAALKWPAFAAGAASARQAPSTTDAASARQAPSAADGTSARRGPTRAVGATVILVNGALTAHLARGDRQLLTWLPASEPERSRAAAALGRALIERARGGTDAARGMLIEEIDGGPPRTHALAPFLVQAGFISGAMGFQPTFPANASSSG